LLKWPTISDEDFVIQTPPSFRSTFVVGFPSYAKASVPIATTAAVTPATDAAVFGFARNHDSAFISHPPINICFVVCAVSRPIPARRTGTY
jgi:hypothetical protein